MSEPNSKTPWWVRIALEGFVIVVSILLALAADAWWQERQDRIAEAEYLDAVAAELADARSDFERHQAFLDEQIEQATTVSDQLRQPGSALSQDSVNFLVRSIAPPRSLVPATAALDDLLSSGGLSLVRSSSLRRGFARYQQALSEDLALQQRLEELWTGLHAPYRYANTDMLPGRGNGRLQLQVDLTAYVNNRQYLNLLVAHRLRMQDLTVRHAVVLRLIGELEAALAPR